MIGDGEGVGPLGRDPRAMAAPVVRQDPFDATALRLEPGDRPGEEAGGRLVALVSRTSA